jgi:hypothetical protein
MFYLMADTQTVRDLRRALQLARETSVGAPVSADVQTSSSVVCKLRTAITAGSTVAAVADIMTLRSGSWVPTGQTIRVRSATGAAVTTTNRVIAKKVSTFGYCVVPT